MGERKELIKMADAEETKRWKAKIVTNYEDKEDTKC